MEQYLEVSFKIQEENQSEILIALLCEIGYDGFEEEPAQLKAFIPESKFYEPDLIELVSPFRIAYSTEQIPARNWNSLWESEFHPVIIDDFVGIRADFHKPLSGIAIEIVITPKMSFGTGHHDTTFLMIESLKHLSLKNKDVADFGTGTGILAILAAKLGAEKVFAIDHDEWSIINAKENFLQNRVDNVSLINAGFFPANSGPWDLVLANINKLVILNNMKLIANTLATEGILVTSGYLLEDEEDIVKSAELSELVKMTIARRNNWLCITFKKVRRVTKLVSNVL